MAQRFCKDCSKTYEVPEGRPDPGFCSDRCFGQYSASQQGAGWFWYVKVLLLIASVALVVLRVDAAVYLAKREPAAAPRCVSFLAWCGGDAVDRLIGLALEGDPAMRTLAVDALGAVPDAEDAQPRVTARMADLKAAAKQWDRPAQGRLLLVFGRCGLAQELDSLVAALKEADLQAFAARALGFLRDKRARIPLLELLGQWEWELKHRPEVLVAVLGALAAVPDEEHVLEAAFLPFLSNEQSTVRAAAAAAVEAQIVEYPHLKEYVKTAPQREQYAIKQRLGRIEKSLAAVGVADQAEKEPGVRAALASVVARSQADPKDWTR